MAGFAGHFYCLTFCFGETPQRTGLELRVARIPRASYI